MDAGQPNDRPERGVPGLVGEEHLAAMLPFLSEAIYVFDRNGDLKARLSSPDGVLGHGAARGSNLFQYLHPDDAPRGMQIGAAIEESQRGWTGEFRLRLRHADGTWRLLDLRVTNCYGDALDGMVGVLREVSEPDATLEPGADSEVDADADELSAIASGLPTAYLALGDQGRIRYASDAATRLLQATREDLVGLPVSELVVDQDQPVVHSAYNTLLHTTGARTVVASTRTRFGGRVVEAEFHTRGTDPEHKLITVVLVDHSSEPELVRLATHDALTGLANRTKVLGTISGLLLDPQPVLSLVYVDLDDLKALNDRHGHEAGDSALIAVAERLRQLVRPGDLVGRMSGDEFVIVCPHLVGADLRAFVQRIGDEAADGHVVVTPDGTEVQITVSAGGATAVAGDSTTTLLRRADEAMFHAKRGRPAPD